MVTRAGFQRTNQTPNEGLKPHKVNGLYGRPVGTRTPDLYRVNAAILGFTTTYKTAGTAKVRGSRIRHRILWVGLWVGITLRSEVSLLAVLSFFATKLDVSGLLSDLIASLHIVACPLSVLTCITAIPGGPVHPDPDFRCRLDEQSSHFPPSVRPRVHEVSHQPAQRIAADWIPAVKGV